jgi:hypothetical protein
LIQPKMAPDRKIRRQIPHRMESCEYAAERN